MEMFLYRNEEGNADSVSFAGEGPERDIAWQAPDATKAEFERFVRAASGNMNIALTILTEDTDG
jgi:hypothetical protein